MSDNDTLYLLADELEAKRQEAERTWTERQDFEAADAQEQAPKTE
ncbi:MAG TPA: hypothetical protein VGP13_03800 [Candidatus Paceibacterota bacterium]|jgi:hypothetical protein|nr:hypothetical protein [Candidatus Paceibacterota bacterium]